VGLYSGHRMAAEGFLNAVEVGQGSAGSAGPEPCGVVNLSTRRMNGHAAEIELDSGRRRAGCYLGNRRRVHPPVGRGLSRAGLRRLRVRFAFESKQYVQQPTSLRLLLSGRGRDGHR
jgi:hypothetical protein